MQGINLLHLAPRASGGLKDHVLTLLRRLDRQRFNLMLAWPASNSIAQDELPEGVKFFPLEIGERLNPWRDRHLLSRLESLFYQEDVQVLHTHGARAGLLGRLAALKAGVPVLVHTMHNQLYSAKGRYLEKSFLALAARRLAVRTQAFIAISKAVQKELLQVERVDPERVRLIYNGIELNRFNNLLDLKRKFRELGLKDGPVVGCVARLIPDKGVDVLLKAAVLLRIRYPYLQLLVVGDGPSRPCLEREAGRLGLLPGVVFTGFRGDVPELLPLLHAFVMPSLHEGLCVAVLEAMAARRPVVASRVGGLMELVEQDYNGCLVPPGDAISLAAAIGRFLEKPAEAERLGANARKVVEERFLAERMVEETADLYESLIAGRLVQPAGEMSNPLPLAQEEP